jgi:hypothetical protein
MGEVARISIVNYNKHEKIDKSKEYGIKFRENDSDDSESESVTIKRSLTLNKDQKSVNTERRRVHKWMVMLKTPPS